MIDPEQLAREAERLLSLGAVAEAEAVCHRLLARVPAHPTALMILSVVAMTAERWSDAERWLQLGCTAHPAVVAFHAALGGLLLQLNRQAEAVAPLENCVLLAPENAAHRVALLGLYQSRLFATFSEVSKAAMLVCLADDALTHSLMNKAWLSLLRVDPEGAELLQVFDGAADFPSFEKALTPALLQGLEQYTLLHSGLRRFLAADVAVERGLTFLRRYFLEHGPERRQYFPLLCALARYCFLTEYVFAVAEEVSSLREDLSAAEGVVLLSCYEPLFCNHGQEELARLGRLSDDPEYRALLNMVVDEPRDEAALAASIGSVTPIDDEVSRAVQAQYEENPYPRWTTVGAVRHGERTDDEAAGGGGDKRILVAGCGTGREAVDAALNFPEARVEAIDLSRASLAYGARQAAKLGVGNVTFAQGDLLRLPETAGPYALITASGVLHHLREPREGLRALLAVLDRGGVLRVGLYSRIARAQVAEARRWIASAGWPPTLAGIRAFRGAVVARDPHDSLRAWLTRSYDFYATSPCRDLVFHVQEHTFTLPEVARLLADFGLSVIHLGIKSPVHLAEYQQRFPHDPSGTSLSNWHSMEQRHPALFAGMYSLWLCRSGEEPLVDLEWLNAAPASDP